MRILTAAACLAGTLFVVYSAEAGNRVAFVVGNGAYKFVQPLPNPTVDAKSMSTLLPTRASRWWKAPISAAKA